jgi:hypothetical protein
MPVKGFPVDKNTQNKGDARLNILQNADGGELKLSGCGSKPKQR